jgi:hypothetical protein
MACRRGSGPGGPGEEPKTPKNPEKDNKGQSGPFKKGRKGQFRTEKDNKGQRKKIEGAAAVPAKDQKNKISTKLISNGGSPGG